LTTAAGTARGTVTIASCNLAVEASTLEPATFPELQPGQTVPLNPCRINPDSGSLRVQNATTGAVSTSEEPNTLPTTDVAFVITTDFATGSYSVIDLASRNAFSDIVPGGIHSDALARAFNGLIYVVNRSNVNSIQVIDPQQGFTTPLNGEVSVDTGGVTDLNPQDIAFVSATKAYVSRLASAKLLVINPTTLAIIGEVDLSDRVKPGDLDGVPELSRMLVHDGRLYVALQHLDNTTGFPPAKVAPGEIVVLNPTTDTVVAVITLNGTNPFSALQFNADLNRILVSSVGDFFVNDGGIEAIDPTTNITDAAFVIDEATMGGDITHFQIVSAIKGFAVVTDATFQNALVSFNPTTGQRLSTLLGPASPFLPHFAINSLGELYLAQSGATTPTQGVRIFNTVTDAEITTTAINVGLPPFFVLFLE
jgi:DNA-binding beta-propeller fold protein YncE